MKLLRITSGGQISIPATIRKRWGTTKVRMEDHGDRVVLQPAPEDPIGAARGAFGDKLSASSKELRELAREDERRAEQRRGR